MLSFESGRPIAVIRGGKLDGDLLFICPPSGNNRIEEVHIPDGKLIPIPEPNKSFRWYTGGCSGCGKSTACASFTKSYQKMYPKNKIYVFKRDTEPDPALKDLKFIEVNLNKETCYSLNNYHNALLIFDDVGSLPDTKKRDQIVNLMRDALENGRKHRVSVCTTNHLLYDGNRTKVQINECPYITVFPGGSNHQIKSLCDRYIGMDSKAIDKLRHLPSRWVQIYNNFPQHVIYDTGAYVL